MSGHQEAIYSDHLILGWLKNIFFLIWSNQLGWKKSIPFKSIGGTGLDGKQQSVGWWGLGEIEMRGWGWVGDIWEI